MRVFYDRLVDDKDRTWLFDTVSHLIKEHFKDTIDNVFEHLANGGQPGGKLEEGDLRSLMFGDYMNPDAEADDKRYEEVKSLEDFYAVAEQCLEEYNNTHKTRMNLVIFRYLRNTVIDVPAQDLYVPVRALKHWTCTVHYLLKIMNLLHSDVQVRAGAPVAH